MGADEKQQTQGLQDLDIDTERVGNWLSTGTSGFTTFIEGLFQGFSCCPQGKPEEHPKPVSPCSRTLLVQLIAYAALFAFVQVVLFKSSCSRCTCYDSLQALLAIPTANSTPICAQITTLPEDTTYMCFQDNYDYSSSSPNLSPSYPPCFPSIKTDSPYAIIGDSWYNIKYVGNTILNIIGGENCYYLTYGGKNPCL